MRLEGRHVGYLQTELSAGEDGGIEYRSRTYFHLQVGAPRYIEKYLKFEAAPPAPAHRCNPSSASRLDTSWRASDISRRGDQLIARTVLDQTPIELDWDYGLADYLDFENWLTEAPRALGSIRAVPVLDLPRLDRVRRSHQLLSANGGTAYSSATRRPSGQPPSGWTPTSCRYTCACRISSSSSVRRPTWR